MKHIYFSIQLSKIQTITTTQNSKYLDSNHKPGPDQISQRFKVTAVPVECTGSSGLPYFQRDQFFIHREQRMQSAFMSVS